MFRLEHISWANASTQAGPADTVGGTSRHGKQRVGGCPIARTQASSIALAVIVHTNSVVMTFTSVEARLRTRSHTCSIKNISRVTLISVFSKSIHSALILSLTNTQDTY